MILSLLILKMVTVAGVCCGNYIPLRVVSKAPLVNQRSPAAGCAQYRAGPAWLWSAVMPDKQTLKTPPIAGPAWLWPASCGRYHVTHCASGSPITIGGMKPRRPPPFSRSRCISRPPSSTCKRTWRSSALHIDARHSRRNHIGGTRNVASRNRDLRPMGHFVDV